MVSASLRRAPVAHSSSRPRLRRVGVFVVVLLTLFAVVVPVASASVSTAPTPAPSGGVPGVLGGGGAGAGQYCSIYGDGSSRQGNAGSGDVVTPYYPGCFGYKWTSQMAFCTNSFEVWRFYGTKASPIQAWSASRAWLPQACNQAFSPLIIFSPHPHDEVVAGHPAWVFSPWMEATTTSSSNGREAFLTSVPAANWLAALRTTTSWPFRHGGACFAFNGDSGIGKFFRSFNPWPYPVPGPLYNEVGAAQIRQEFLALWDYGNAHFGPHIADTLVNGQRVGNEIVYGDGYLCNSDLDFATQSPASATPVPVSPTVQRQYGACWMPVARQMRRYSQFPNGGGASWYAEEKWYPEFYNYAWQGGIPLGNDQYSMYRALINFEVATRQPWENQGAVPGSNRSPVSPLAGWSPGLVAANFAGCAYGQGASSQAPTYNLEQHETPSAYRVTVTTPQAAQVGGKIRPATITTGNATALCGSPTSRHACKVDSSTGPFVTSVNADIKTTPASSHHLQAPSGYPAASFKDYWSKVPTSPKAAGTLVGEFYRATDPGKLFTATLSGTVTGYVVDKLTYSLTRPCGWFKGNNSFQSGSIVTSPIDPSLCTYRSVTNPHRNFTVPIVPQYAQLNAAGTAVSRANAGGAGFPVISATATPRAGR